MCVWTRSGKEVMGCVYLSHALSLSLPLWNAKIILKLLVRYSNVGIINVNFLDKVNFLINGGSIEPSTLAYLFYLVIFE